MNELMNTGTEKTCPRCGTSFLCTHDALCQCVGITLNEKARAYLRTHYTNCLCSKCLLEVQAEFNQVD